MGSGIPGVACPVSLSVSSAERLNCNSAEDSSGVVVYGGTILQDMPKVPVRLGQKSPVVTYTV